MVKLGSTLESSRKDKRLANSDNIYDKRLDKMQEEINQEVSSLSPVDEEDLTRSFDDNGRSVTKFADRSYSPQNFSGKGYKILRKNIKPVSLATTKIIVSSIPTSDGYIAFIINGVESHVDVVASTDTTTEKVAAKINLKLTETMIEYEVSQSSSTITLTRNFESNVSTPSSYSAVGTGTSCVVTDSTKVELRNIITQGMINQPNIIYEIRYDFDLNGQEITIPEGCTLKFNGGNLTNGLIISNKTKIQNAPYIDGTDKLKITGKVYDINNNEITHYKWEIINRKCKLYTTLIPWWDFLNDVENAYRIGVTDFHIVLHISSNNNTNFEVTDPYYYSDERFVNKILKYNLSTPCLKLHIDEGKPFGSAPYNTVSYIENTINYVKTLVSKYRELGLKFDKFWVSNEHINVTCNDDNNSADLWRSYLIDLKTWLQTNYNISCWASLQEPILTMASYNDINISANFYPRISSFDDRYCSNVDTLNNLVSQINTYIASCPNNISYVISECGCTGRYKSLRVPEAYSLKGQKHLYIFDKFYRAIVEALNQCQIDEWVIWYGDAPSGLKGAQDLVYNILRKLL